MGSLFSALTTAISGLGAQSSAIGNISDNLANAQTVGYKSVTTSFEQLVNSSNSTVNNPGGVSASPSYQNGVQGSLTSSSVSTSLAISGSGYFAVEAASQSSTGQTVFNEQVLYTRQGDFSLDKDGYIVNGSGYYLTGYTVDSNGNVDTSHTSPIQVSTLLNAPVATQEVDYSANLPSNAAVNYESTASTVQIYDSLGNTHDVTYTWTKTATNEWSLEVTSPDASYDATIPVTFNDGSSGSAGTISSISSSGTGSSYTVGTGTAADISIALNFPGTGTQNVTLNFGNYGDSSGVTQFSDTNTSVSVNNFSQDGLPQGSFSSLGIDSSGQVSINYSNGTNRTIAQIPVVQFFAENQLQRVTGGAFEATLASGTPRYSMPGGSGAGTIASSSLEQSNVDIATEFTNLIQAQQVYSANAKVVTANNQLLQTTINMVQ